MNTSEIGERAEGAVLAALLKNGYFVLTPFGASRRYDLVFEDGEGKFCKVQVKHGRLKDDVVVFNTINTTGRVAKDYSKDVDFFGVHASDLNKVYLVPIEGLPAGQCHLRLAPCKNNNVKGIRWATDYELD